MPKKTKKKLSRRERELASQLIAQECRTGQYARPQSIAIGISRARQEAAREKLDKIVAKYL